MCQVKAAYIAIKCDHAFHPLFRKDQIIFVMMFIFTSIFFFFFMNLCKTA